MKSGVLFLLVGSFIAACMAAAIIDTEDAAMVRIILIPLLY